MTDPLECTAAMGRFLRVGDLFLSATYPELLVIFPCRLLLQYTLQIKNLVKQGADIKHPLKEVRYGCSFKTFIFQRRIVG